jgi:deoxyribose-phosphate aldolase
VGAAKGRAIVKVIIEACLLTDEEKVEACQLSKAAGANFVKTSTGFSKWGAKVEDVKLMRNTVGSEMGVKASGGVHSFEDAVKMIEAGATRIGASSSLKIIGKTAEEKAY